MKRRLIPEGERGWGLLPLLSAILLVLAQPPFQVVLLPFLALVPLVVSLGRNAAEDTGHGLVRAVRIGVAFGTVYWGILLLWVPLEVGRRFWWAFPGYLAQVCLLTGLTALMAWATCRLNRSPRVPLFLAFPLAWVGMEWMKAHFPLGLSFPWLGLGVTLTAWPEALGVAEWIGEGGVAFWLALVNGLLAAAVLAWHERAWGGRRWGGSPDPADSSATRRIRMGRISPRSLIWAAGACAFLPALLGVARGRALDLHPGPRVLVVGTGVYPGLRADPLAGSREGIDQVEELLRGLHGNAADLIVLPEALVRFPLADSLAGPFRRRLEMLAEAQETPLIFGAMGERPGDGSALPTNSLFLLDRSGELSGRYDKVRLVPGMEQGAYEAGNPVLPLDAGTIRLGPLICYESIFGDLARRYGREGGTLLVNISSDVWFGRWGAWPGRGFLSQHPAHLVLRAVENRIGVARAANGGISLLLDPVGRAVVEPIPPGPGIAVASIPVVSGSTLFSRTGDLVGLISVLLCGGLILLSPAGRPAGPGKTQSPDPPTG